jgi:hypothetical protein
MRVLALILLFSSAVWAQDTIKLERTGCFGACPVYTVEIKNDGTVTYEGRANVAVQGKKTASISKEKIQDLFRRFEEAGVFEMIDRSLPIMDAPSVILEVKVGTQSRRVQDYRLEETDVKKLAKLVDEVAETARWVARR